MPTIKICICKHTHTAHHHIHINSFKINIFHKVSHFPIFPSVKLG